MKKKVSRPAEKSSSPKQKKSLLGNILQAIGKPSTDEKVSTVDEKTSTGEKVSDGDEKSLAGEKVSVSDEKSLAGEKKSDGSAKSPVLKFSNIDDTTPSSQQKDLQSLGTFSAPENILMPDDKSSPLEVKTPSPQKVSTPEVKPSPQKISVPEVKTSSPQKNSTPEVKPSPQKNSTPEVKTSPQKISVPEVKTSSPQKNSTPEVKTSSPQKISTPEIKPSPEKKLSSNKVEEYTITIKGGSRDRVIKLSSKMFRLGTASIIVGGILLLATSAWSFYSSLRMQRDAATIREVEQAAELRQEQLLTLSKKAAALDETIQNLTRQEEELRIQAGLNPIKDEAETPPETPAENSTETPPTENPASTETPAENSSDENNGQGGPVGELTVTEVSEALDMLEAKVDRRRKSLDEFQAELKQRREQMAAGARVASGYTPGSSTSFVPGGGVEFDFANGLPIIPAAGSIPAPGSFPFDPSLVGGNGAADSHIPSIWPTTGVVTSPYGLRWGGTDFHPGMDIANDMGTPIVATADGVVDYAGWNSGGYGNMVDIDHGNGIMTRYGHASQVVVSAGQHVKRGQLIAYMGSTGFSTGPHVHYEVHVNGNRVNPISYL